MSEEVIDNPEPTPTGKLFRSRVIEALGTLGINLEIDFKHLSNEYKINIEVKEGQEIESIAIPEVIKKAQASVTHAGLSPTGTQNVKWSSGIFTMKISKVS